MGRRCTVASVAMVLVAMGILFFLPVNAWAPPDNKSVRPNSEPWHSAEANIGDKGERRPPRNEAEEIYLQERAPIRNGDSQWWFPESW